MVLEILVTPNDIDNLCLNITSVHALGIGVAERTDESLMESMGNESS